jgi:hypothetical protein
VGQTQLGSFYQQKVQQKVLSRFPVCCWIDWLLMIKNYLIEFGPPCIISECMYSARVKSLTRNGEPERIHHDVTLYTTNLTQPETHGIHLGGRKPARFLQRELPLTI